MCQGNQFIIIAQLIDHNRSVNIVIIDNNTSRVNTLTVKTLTVNLGEERHTKATTKDVIG